MTTRISVGGDYDVLVGEDLGEHLPELLAGAGRVAVVFAPPLREYAAKLATVIAHAGMEPVAIGVPDAEAAKTVAEAERAWTVLGDAGFTRTDAVVGVGGGAVTDLAGFVAACWLRGVRVVQVPTSLLGMVDAAVGGKTGVNTAAGKNLVGAFWPPAGVLCDLSTLDTLPREDLAAGLAEVVKCGFIADPSILDIIERDPTSPPPLRELVEKAIRVKADVVSQDLREGGLREILNYGHTLAHAIEKVENYSWKHGHAVSVGLVFAASLSALAGRLDAATAVRHRAILEALDLPVSYADAPFEQLLHVMRVDKKSRGAMLRFVVLDKLAEPGILADPSVELLKAAFREVSG